MKTILSLWNRFIVGLICFMMVNVNITVDNQIIEMNMSSVAYAAEDGGSSSSSNSNVQQGQQGTVKVEDESGGALGFLTGGTMSFIVFMAAAIIIGKMLAMCAPKSWDLMSAAAGAVIFIAGELMTMFGNKAEVDSKKMEFSTHGDDGKIDDTQYQALVKEKEILESVEKAAKTKANLQMAASAAFGVAAGIAAYNASQQVVMALACETKAGASVFCAPMTALTAEREAYKLTTIPSAGKLTVSKAKDTLIIGTSVKCVAAASAAAASSAGIASAAVIAAEAASLTCNSYVALHQNSEMACMAYAAPAEAATGFMIPFAAIAKGIGVAADYFAGSAVTRGWLWFGLSAYGLAVSNATKKQAKKARENIKEIDKLLAKMDMSRTESVMAQSNISKVNLSGALSQNLARPTELSAAVPCATGNGKLDQKTGQFECPPVIKPNANSQSRKSLSASGYEGAVNLASELVSGIQGNKTITPSVQANIDKLAASNNAIQKKMRNNFKRLNLARKKAGLKPYNVEKMANKAFGRLRKAAQKSLNQSGLTPDSLLAKARLGLPPIDEANKEETTKTEDNAIATTGGKAIQPKKNDFKFDFNVDDEVAMKEAEFAKNEKAAAEAGDENEDKGDIIEDKSVSIFKVISIRYMKSGFNRLLDEL